VGYETDVSTQLLRFDCAICGRPLRDPASLERGWGPVCDKKHMGGSGSKRVWEAMVHDLDLREAAAALADAPTIVPTRWVEPVINPRSGKPEIERVFKAKEELPDGTKARGGEILTRAEPLRVPSLRDYWKKIGGSPERGAWREDVEIRRTMVSRGIWYASRAVTFGYAEHVVTAEKVDPRWAVVASVQRFARAVGMPGVADRMTEFYGAKVMMIFREKVFKKTKKGDPPERREVFVKTEVVVERVHPDHPIRGRAAGPGMMRIHTPFNDQWNRLASSNRDVFVAIEKDVLRDARPHEASAPYYFWRYFRATNLRKVVNLVQEAYGERQAILRDMLSPAERDTFENQRRGKVLVADLQTQTARWFDPATAERLTAAVRYQVVQ
jgi:hypothetical protein